jgi:hypothetical protein
MKKLLQIVVIVVVALLMAQPAIAGLSCDMGRPVSGPCAPDCGEAMSQMGMDCQKPMQVASTGCEQNCCMEGIPQGVFRLTADRKHKAGNTEILALVPRISADDVMAFAAPPFNLTVASGPPRYVLLQVFRI